MEESSKKSKSKMDISSKEQKFTQSAFQNLGLKEEDSAKNLLEDNIISLKNIDIDLSVFSMKENPKKKTIVAVEESLLNKKFKNAHLEEDDCLIGIPQKPFQLEVITNPKTFLKERKGEPYISNYGGMPLSRDLLPEIIREENMPGLQRDWILKGLSSLSGIDRTQIETIENWLNKNRGGKSRANLGERINYERIKEILRNKFSTDWIDNFVDAIWNDIERYDLLVKLNYNNPLYIPYLDFDIIPGKAQFKGNWWKATLGEYLNQLRKKYKREINPIKELLKINTKNLKIIHSLNNEGIVWAYWYYKIYEEYCRNKITRVLSDFNFFGKINYEQYKQIPNSALFIEKKRWVRDFINEFIEKNMKIGYFPNGGNPIYKSFEEWKNTRLCEKTRNIDIVRSEIFFQIFDWLLSDIFVQTLNNIVEETQRTTGIEDPLRSIIKPLLERKYIPKRDEIWHFKKLDNLFLRKISNRINLAILGYIVQEQKEHTKGVRIDYIIEWINDNLKVGEREMPFDTIMAFLHDPLLFNLDENKILLTDYGNFWVKLIEQINPKLLNPNLTQEVIQNFIPKILTMLDLWEQIAKGKSVQLDEEESKYYKKIEKKKIQHNIGFIGLRILDFLTESELNYLSLERRIKSFLKRYQIGIYYPSFYISDYFLKEKELVGEIEKRINECDFISRHSFIKKHNTVKNKPKYEEFLNEINIALDSNNKSNKWNYPDDLLLFTKGKIENILRNLSHTRRIDESFEDYIKRFDKILLEWNKWLGTAVEKINSENNQIEIIGLFTPEINQQNENIRIIINKKLMNQLLNENNLKILPPTPPFSPSNLIEESKKEYSVFKEKELEKMNREITEILAKKPILRNSNDENNFEAKIKIHQDNIVLSLRYVKEIKQIIDKYSDSPVLKEEYIKTKKDAIKNWNSITQLVKEKGKFGRDIIIPELWTSIDFDTLLDGYLENKIIEGKKGDYVQDWKEKVNNWNIERLT